MRFGNLIMNLNFYKYQGTGNDFVMIDNRQNIFPKNDTKLIKRLCDRHFGIGADGLILLENDKNADFRMVYYNSDGNQSTMCGNGGRCITAFAKQLEIIYNKAEFNAVDGLHHAKISESGEVALQMKDINNVVKNTDFTFLDTGSPHHVLMVSDLNDFDVKYQGAKIRYSDLYGKDGVNVNFVTQISDDVFRVRTYERGVEDETLSCGTGATAVAVAMHATGMTKSEEIALKTEGGKLTVSFRYKNGQYTNVFLKGNAVFVFSGVINLLYII